MPLAQVLLQHWLVRVQGWKARRHMATRQVPWAHTPEQQWEPSVQGPSRALQVVSQRPPRHRWLQQSMLVVQAPPGFSQVRSQREEKLQRLPAQHQEVLRQNTPVPAQETCRHTPAEQLREQHSSSVAQVAPSREQDVAVRQTPLEHISPSQHPAPQACPSTEQVAPAWQVPLEQVRPSQHPLPQGCPRGEQRVGARQVPAVHVSPAQHPLPQGCPSALQVVAAWQVPSVQREPVQHSPSYTQRLPVGRQTQVPPEQSM